MKKPGDVVPSVAKVGTRPRRHCVRRLVGGESYRRHGRMRDPVPVLQWRRVNS